MIKKGGNPKDAIGVRKAAISVVPACVILGIGLALLEGARKYGRHNYRAAGVRASVYYDAAFRHMSSFWEGQDIDPDSGLHHIDKAMASLAVLRDSIVQGNWVDDRPPRSPDGWERAYNEAAAALIDRIPTAEEPYTEVELRGPSTSRDG